MNTRKSTKRALLTSVMCIVLCISMLSGATLAWFTDTATTEVNAVQSGILDVDLVDASGNTLVGDSLEFVAADGRNQNEILWEPGCTYELEEVYVANKGNLALKFKVEINKDGVTGDVKLLDALEFTVKENGTEIDIDTYVGHVDAGLTSQYPIVISGHMREDAGNEYMDLAIENLAITVYATQDTVEEDSYDNNYDADATLDFAPASDEDDLFRAAAAGSNVTLSNNVDVTADIVMSESSIIDGEGYTLYKDATNDEGTNAGVLTSGGSINNISISGSGSNAEGKGFRAVYAGTMSDDLSITNATLEGTYALNASGTGALTVKNTTLNGWTSFDVDSAVFENCEFTGNGSSADGYDLNTVRAYNDTVMTDCSFTSPYYFSAGASGITIEINHCTFGGEAITAVNFAELFEIESGDKLFDCTVIVDGKTVEF